MYQGYSRFADAIICRLVLNDPNLCTFYLQQVQKHTLNWKSVNVCDKYTLVYCYIRLGKQQPNVTDHAICA